jgi:signal transduction histidine kinase
MSHEIRTPMTAIMGFADELERKVGALGADSDITDALRTIQRNGAHLLDLINDLLDLSKIEAGKLLVESLPCSAVAIVAEVAHLLRPQALAKGLCLEARCEGPVPREIRSDAIRLRQIVTNLVQNAIKFTASGDVT